MEPAELDALGQADSWEGVNAVVVGFAGAGFAATDNLTHLGATVTAYDTAHGDDVTRERAELLGILGATVTFVGDDPVALPDETDVLVVTQARWYSDELVEQAVARRVPVWGGIELAWRLRNREAVAPWLVVAGHRGRSTTARMTEAILRAAGERPVCVGGEDLPIVEAVMDPTVWDAVVIDADPLELHYTYSMSAESAVVLNVQPGASTLGTMLQAYERAQRACVYNAADPLTEALVRDADVVEGARAIGFTLGTPGVGMVGVVEDLLVDRAFIEERSTSAAELCTLEDLAATLGVDVVDLPPFYVEDALAAAALARAHGVSQVAVRDGLRGFTP